MSKKGEFYNKLRNIIEELIELYNEGPVEEVHLAGPYDNFGEDE